MAPISKIFLSVLALCLANPVLSAPVNTNALVTRQLAGEGAAADSIFSDTDNGVGYGVEDAEDNIANNISQAKGTSGGATSTGSGSPPAAHKRQLDKVVNGSGAIANAAGVGGAYAPVVAAGDNADGTATSDAANTGATIGGAEESTLEEVGSSVP